MSLRALVAASLATLSVALMACEVAQAEIRTGRTSEGVALRLDGRTFALRIPRTFALRGAGLRVKCGRELRGAARTAEARAARVRPGQRLRLRLPRDVSAGAEFCAFVETGRDKEDAVYGVAALRPAGMPAPAPLIPGPGVRQGATSSADNFEGEDGDATFLLRESTLTVRVTRAFAHSSLITLGCEGQDDRQAGFRTLAVGRGRRSLTADIAVPAGLTPTVCLIEDDLSGGDIAVAAIAP